MNIPSFLRIGPLDYTVSVVDEIKDGKGKVVKNSVGHTSYQTCALQIQSGNNYGYQTVTLWHEILHVIAAQGSLEDLSETEIDVIAHGIMQVLRDNPALRQL